MHIFPYRTVCEFYPIDGRDEIRNVVIGVLERLTVVETLERSAFVHLPWNDLRYILAGTRLERPAPLNGIKSSGMPVRVNVCKAKADRSNNAIAVVHEPDALVRNIGLRGDLNVGDADFRVEVRNGNDEHAVTILTIGLAGQQEPQEHEAETHGLAITQGVASGGAVAL